MAVLALFISFHATAQVTDTLTAVTLVSKKPMDITTAVTPVQQLNKTSLTQLNSLSVADAVKYFTEIKDNYDNTPEAQSVDGLIGLAQ